VVRRGGGNEIDGPAVQHDGQASGRRSALAHERVCPDEQGARRDGQPLNSERRRRSRSARGFRR
jgi:hypothetical protein